MPNTTMRITKEVAEDCLAYLRRNETLAAAVHDVELQIRGIAPYTSKACEQTRAVLRHMETMQDDGSPDELLRLARWREALGRIAGGDTIPGTIRRLARENIRAACTQGYKGAPSDYVQTAADCTYITDEVLLVFGRLPSRAEWEEAGLPGVGGAHCQGTG